MVIDYKILTADSAENLDAKVNEYREQGWQPQGGLALSVYLWDGVICETFAQAMALIARREIVKNTRDGVVVSGG